MDSSVIDGSSDAQSLGGEEILSAVLRELAAVRLIDVHTHLFMPSLGSLGLWGIDHLITYHYLEAELFRVCRISPDEYWGLSVPERGDLIWRTLFGENTPLSESTRGVIAVLKAFGLNTQSSDLSEAREFFNDLDPASHIDDVFRLSGVSEVVMTNDPLDPVEAPYWEQSIERDRKFHAALRLDRILDNWRDTIQQGRRFLAGWCDKMQPVYMALSLPDSFQFPEESARGRLLADAVLPTCREYGIPISLMIGVRRQVNPDLRLAGDASGRADLRALERLCSAFPENRFLVSVLSRENQHELCVYARKFSNLMPFGCWWFLNNPSIVEEITSQRFEMLGTSFIPQHSDARVLEQLIYKWQNARRTLAPILARRYKLLAEDGRSVTAADIRGDIATFRRKIGTSEPD